MYQECRHIMPSGRKCHSPAMRSKAYCYYHLRAHERIGRANHALATTGDAPIEMPFLEDRGAVQIALSEVVSALASHRIDFKRASLLIYALQVASSNAKNADGFIAEEPVRELSQNEDGEPLGPEITAWDQDDPEYLDHAKDDDLTIDQILIRGLRKMQAEQRGESNESPQTDLHDNPEPWNHFAT